MILANGVLDPPLTVHSPQALDIPEHWVIKKLVVEEAAVHQDAPPPPPWSLVPDQVRAWPALHRGKGMAFACARDLGPGLPPAFAKPRHDQMEQGPTEPHAGRGTFLLSSGGVGGRVLLSGLCPGAQSY